MIAKQSGTTIARRLRARTWGSYCPDHWRKQRGGSSHASLKKLMQRRFLFHHILNPQLNKFPAVVAIKEDVA